MFAAAGVYSRDADVRSFLVFHQNAEYIFSGAW